MIGNFRFGSSLAFLILAALTGLVGFFIVYHYASFQRPIQRFAVVIDAGSTQTRSNLYAISLDPSGLNDETATSTPVGSVIQVREVASCVNGGPLAAISSPDDANRLLGKCLPKFARKIKRLDFVAAMMDDGLAIIDDQHEDDDENRHLDTEEVDRQMALLNHRVNSVTHIHLGATAGMRALELLQPAKAERTIHWIQGAIERSNANLLAGTIFMNPGFVGIIEGTSEASFGWLSVNFACDKLPIDTGAAPEATAAIDEQQQKSDAKYSIHGNEMGPTNFEHQPRLDDSIGTLELGGASAQMAFEMSSGGKMALNESMRPDSLQLFGNKYHLATRSDLCLGMSQAILRTSYILLREYFDQSADKLPTGMLVHASDAIEIENPCQQNGSRSSLSSGIVDGILNGACLDVSSDQKIQGEKFKQFISSSSMLSSRQVVARLQIVGSGNVGKCDRLLSKLVEPQECRKLFSLCPASKNKRAPPKGMPFVTISGYNKALQVLNLSRQLGSGSQQAASVGQTIGHKLGGHSIDYTELEHKTKRFCSLDVKEFPLRFPSMNKHFYDVNCLQIIYIRKLLTEFYQFKADSWNQIKFLLFPVEPSARTNMRADQPKEQKESRSIDIGWTLGLLLNATSWELASEENSGSNDIVFHHGASIQFVIRTTVFIMFACVFIAGSIVVFSVVLARRKHRTAYVCHSGQDGDAANNSNNDNSSERIISSPNSL